MIADLKIGDKPILENCETNGLGPLNQDPLGLRHNRRLAQTLPPPGGGERISYSETGSKPTSKKGGFESLGAIKSGPLE